MKGWISRHKGYMIAGSLLFVFLAALLASKPGHDVQVADAFVGPLDLRIAASGLVESNAADLAFQASGELVSLYAREGESVKESQLLARLQPAGVPPHSLGTVDAIQAPLTAYNNVAVHPSVRLHVSGRCGR